MLCPELAYFPLQNCPVILTGFSENFLDKLRVLVQLESSKIKLIIKPMNLIIVFICYLKYKSISLAFVLTLNLVKPALQFVKPRGFRFNKHRKCALCTRRRSRKVLFSSKKGRSDTFNHFSQLQVAPTEQISNHFLEDLERLTIIEY